MRILDYIPEQQLSIIPHYSTPINSSFLDDEYGQKYLAIHKTITLSLEYFDPVILEKCIEADYAIAFHSKPWTRYFQPGALPSDKGPTYKKELDFIKGRAELIKKITKEKEYLKQFFFVFETERFFTRGDDQYNKHVLQKYQDYEFTLDYLFDKKVGCTYYLNGLLNGPYKNGWAWGAHFRGIENSVNGYKCAQAYEIYHPHLTRDTIRKNYGVGFPVAIWLALGAGYEYGIKFKKNLNYSLQYAYYLGKEINNPWYWQDPKRHIPQPACIVFYPNPSDTNNLNFWWHYAAYVNGALNIPINLEELQEAEY